MAHFPEYKSIFNYAIDALDNAPISRRALIDEICRAYGLTDSELVDSTASGNLLALRSKSGTVINDMEAKGIISRGEDGLYRKSTDKAVAIRIEKCEERIIYLVTEKPRSRNELRTLLADEFGTLNTATERDDNRLYTYMGQILKRLVDDGSFDYDGSKYSVAPERRASIKNKEKVLRLKAEFLSRIHARGGEFFEHYFLNLAVKYLILMGKTVTESYVTGGSADGGIDGVIKTVDSLGFRETVMIQMKNRNDIINETDVRGFWGAVCAKQGSRGIFATTSDFHPAARELLYSIDDCVGVNGDKIFSMACDTSYGIKRDGDVLVIDNELI